MEELPHFETMREAVAADSRQHGHMVCVFVGCDHWFDVCFGILRRMGYEEYVGMWSRCRCVWEDEHTTVFVSEWCPECEDR